MSLPATTVTIYLPGATTVAPVLNITTTRGRATPLFTTIPAGTGALTLGNEDRKFDPLNASSPYFGQIIPGKRVTIADGGVTTFDGFVADWNFNYDLQGGRSYASAVLEDGLGKLGRATFNAWTTTNGDQPGARLTAVLARPEVGYTGATSFSQGSFYLQADSVTWGSNVLNYCQLVSATDQGLFFVSRTGALTFKDRGSFINVTPSATLGPAGIPFDQITTSYGTELLYNRVAISALNGTQQSVSDATSIAAYGATYALQASNLLMQDNQSALDLANRLLKIYKDPLYRFESISIPVHTLSGANQAIVLGLDIGAVVTVTWTPNNLGSAMTRTCVVEGVRRSSTPTSYVLQLTLNDSSIAQTGHYWTVEDVTYGAFSAGGVLNFPIAF